MSSLLQSPGRVRSDKGVEIFMYRIKLVDASVFDAETIWLTRPNGSRAKLPVLYRVWRKVRGTFGCWVVFRIDGKDQVPDLSVPMQVEKLPRDAQRLTEEEMIKYWFTNH